MKKLSIDSCRRIDKCLEQYIRIPDMSYSDRQLDTMANALDKMILTELDQYNPYSKDFIAYMEVSNANKRHIESHKNIEKIYSGDIFDVFVVKGGVKLELNFSEQLVVDIENAFYWKKSKNKSNKKGTITVKIIVTH